MKGKSRDPKRLIANLMRDTLEHGSQVEIEGLGSFFPEEDHKFRFVPQDQPRVFIAYVQEDVAYARTLYDRLAEVGFSPWLDNKKLLPGQNWPRSIEMAIESSDFFVACFSRQSVSKRGTFHSELRFALECGSRVPLDEIFFIPVRIEECVLPGRIAQVIQYVDLFPDWGEGWSRLVKTMVEQNERRKRKQLPLRR